MRYFIYTLTALYGWTPSSHSLAINKSFTDINEAYRIKRDIELYHAEQFLYIVIEEEDIPASLLPAPYSTLQFL